jgi:hypothetical protein
MSEGQSQRSIVSSAQRRQEAEVAAAETAATAARAARLAMVELAAAKAEVEATTAAAELETLRGSSASSSVSANGGTNDELKLAREAAREQGVQWAAAHPQGRGGGSPGVRGRVGGWVDRVRGLYTWRGSPSPDRYHGHHGIQAIVRDVSPGGGWSTLTKTNYVEWAAVMRVRLQVRHMWEAVRYGDVDYYEDRRALDALIAAVPPEMQFSLFKKRTAKEA